MPSSAPATLNSALSALGDILSASTDLRSLANSLGRHYLDNADQINRELDSIRAFGSHFLDLTSVVQQEPFNAFPPVLNPVTVDKVNRMDSTPALATVAFLYGLCQGALGRFFATHTGEVWLEPGDPFPLPSRPASTRLPIRTPNPATARAASLLSDAGFGVISTTPWKVRLVFTDRFNLDSALWLDGDYFPSMATIHPMGRDQLTFPEVTTTDWFGVRPKVGEWSEGDVMDALRSTQTVGDSFPPCNAAVLPEVCLPSPDALKDALRDNWEQVPSIVVPGSCHVRETRDGVESWSNEARLYVNGLELLSHRKVHPFKTKRAADLGKEADLAAALPERLSRADLHLSIACGNVTRLAVLICADALDGELISCLSMLGVNIVLVPSLTGTIAGFEALTFLSSQNQAVSLVSNGDLNSFAAALFAPTVPAMTRFDPPNGTSPPAGFVFDPNDPAREPIAI